MITVFILCPLGVWADELSSYGIYDRDEYISSVPETALSTEEVISGVLSGERLFELLRDVFLSRSKEIFGQLPGLVGILFLAVICNGFSSGTDASAVTAVNLIAFVYIFRIVSGIYTQVTDELEVLRGYSLTLSGVMTSFLSFDSSLNGASVMSSFTVILCSFLSFVAVRVMPAVCATVTVSAVSSGSGKSLGSFSGMVTGLYMTALGACLSIMTLIVSFQSKAAVGADSVIRRGAKIASAYTIPVVGGALSEAFDNIGKTVGVIRTSFGLGAALVIILSALPGIVSVIIYRMIFILLAAFCEITGADRVLGLIRGMDGLFNVMLITLALSTIAYLYSLYIFCTLGV